jgi:TonB family protein
LQATPIAGSCLRPEYPLASIRAQETGTSVIALAVDAAGKVTGTSVVKSSGSARLDRAAADALWSCRFLAARDAAGAAVRSTYPMRFEWRLDDAPPDPWVALRALKGAGFAATLDLAAVPFRGESAATAEQRTKILQALRTEALDKAMCPSVEGVSSRIAPTDRNTNGQKPLELWTVTQCGLAMRYVLALALPETGRPSFRMMPLAASQPDPFGAR